MSDIPLFSVTWWPSEGDTYRAELSIPVWKCEHRHKTREAAHRCAQRRLRGK